MRQKTPRGACFVVADSQLNIDSIVRWVPEAQARGAWPIKDPLFVVFQSLNEPTTIIF